MKAGKQIVSKDNIKSSSLSYMSRESCDRWTKEDLERFYRGLQLFGTDFGMIESSIFSGKRSRQQIKVSSLRPYSFDCRISSTRSSE